MSRIAMVVVVCALLVGGVACSSPSEPLDGPDLVQTTSASASGPSLTVTLPRPAGMQNLLVAAVSWTGGSGLAVDGAARSWAATGPVRSNGTVRGQLIYAIVERQTPVTVSAPGGSAVRVELREYSGVDASAPLLAGSDSVTPPTPDRQGTGLLVTAVTGVTEKAATGADRPATVRDRVIRLTGRPDPLVDADRAGSMAFSAVFFAGPSAAPTRDPMRQPFASTSIWNTAIGSSAVFTPAGLPAVPGGDRFAPMPQNDPTSIFETPDAPMTPLRYSNAGWTGRSRCGATGSKVWFEAPMPASYVVPTSGDNEGASWLMPDRRTVLQSSPLARCTVGGYATSVDTSDPLDLYGDGLSRSLGGSGLSGMVGALRRGELRPDTDGTGVRHVLRVNIDTSRQIPRCPTEDSCFRWPATTADSDAVNSYGTMARDAPSAMKLGALLAIPSSVDIGALGLRTAPGRQLAWTLQNYGAYVADSTACACFAIVTEKGPDGDFASQFAQDYGFAFAARVADGTAWTRDLQKLQTVLAVVDNNGPRSIGGGGLPVQPSAPNISP